MLENIIIAVLSITFGIIIANIFNHVEISNLKTQLFNSEEENDKLMKENKGLRKHNAKLYDHLKEIHELHDVALNNIPDFDEW